MRRFLNNLFRDFRSTSTARDSRRAPRRATLQVEGLEDRLVMTSATQLASTVMHTIPAGPSVALTQPIVKLTTIKASTTNQAITGVSLYIGQPALITISTDGAGHIDVVDPVIGLNDQFPIATVRSFSIFVQNGSNVQIDDSKGMPFAPGTTVDLNGSSPASSGLSLGGSLALGNETYVAGGMPWTPGSISLGGVTFVLHSAIGSVYDGIPITGIFDVQTSGTSVGLTNQGYTSSQVLYGMGVGGGDYLAYSNKPDVTLDTFAPNASVFLDAPDAAVGESYFAVNMRAAGQTTTIDETPKNVLTVANADPPATQSSVALWGNFGPVIIDGNSATAVNVGYPLNSTGPVTRGIEANVTVVSASSLVVNNSGNTSTFENVTVTDHTISGSGLFGNNNVIVSYSNVGTLILDTGHVSDTYTVVGSRPGARFSSTIDIIDLCAGQFHADVFVDSGSHLNLSLNKVQLGSAAGLTIHPGGGNVVLPGRLPRKPESGTADVYFAGILSSQVSFLNFDAVGVQG
jgi:hypothetical protein